MLPRYRLFRFFLRNLVRLAGDEGDELDAALDQKVTRIFGERKVWRENLPDDFLYRSLREGKIVIWNWNGLAGDDGAEGYKVRTSGVIAVVRHGGRGV